MQVHERMSTTLRVIGPDQTLQEAARLMCEVDSGALPVEENHHLVGMITDRDIVVRAIAEGYDGRTKVREVMTRDVDCCFEDEELESALTKMQSEKVRRLPVLNRNNELKGMLSLGDISQYCDMNTIGSALKDISTPGGKHDQLRH